MQADCTNHKERINFKNKLWTIDKWFLRDNENVTFGQVIEFLKQENISFIIEPAYKGCEENVIKCINSKVTFDFVNEYRLVELNAKGKFEKWKEVTEEDQINYALNGIRFFEY